MKHGKDEDSANRCKIKISNVKLQPNLFNSEQSLESLSSQYVPATGGTQPEKINIRTPMPPPQCPKRGLDANYTLVWKMGVQSPMEGLSSSHSKDAKNTGKDKLGLTWALLSSSAPWSMS